MPVHEYLTLVDEEQIYAGGTLQLEIVHVTGDDRLAVHNQSTIVKWIGIAMQVLECFLPPQGSFALKLLPDRGLPLDESVENPAFMVRQCAVVGAWQLNSRMVVQENVGHLETLTRAKKQDYVSTVHCVAPHLFTKDADGDDSRLAWVFSSGYSKREEGNVDHYTLSTFMLNHEPDFKSDAQRLRGFLQMLLYSSFTVACGLTPCENVPCVMNNVDGVDESRLVPLLLCPGCLRKLEVTGALPDVMTALRQLQQLYQGLEQGTACFPGELAILGRWLGQ